MFVFKHSFQIDEQDPLSFKANLNNFANAQENEDEDDDIIKKGSDNDEFDDDVKSNDAKRKGGIYVPPKIKPVYNGNIIISN
jgi:hypothetical protein